MGPDLDSQVFEFELTQSRKHAAAARGRLSGCLVDGLLLVMDRQVPRAA